MRMSRCVPSICASARLSVGRGSGGRRGGSGWVCGEGAANRVDGSRWLRGKQGLPCKGRQGTHTKNVHSRCRRCADSTT
eukprot:40780-Eustigmatos_ZCMA.PRE.1